MENISRTKSITGDSLAKYPALSLAATIQDMGDMIERISDVEYSSIPGPEFTSSIVSQIRHTLDHIRIFVDAVESGSASYDTRERGTEIETNRLKAIKEIHDLAEKLTCIRSKDLTREIMIHIMLHSSTEPGAFRSTLGREIGFLLNHTIHHNALISIILKKSGKEVNATFGFAPSTIAYKKLDEK